MKQTSFGAMKTLHENAGEVVSEVLYFEREGRGHSHEKWEMCHVTKGGGVIVVGDKDVVVTAGDLCLIPPYTTHWMKPDPIMEVILVYSHKAPRL